MILTFLSELRVYRRIGARHAGWLEAGGQRIPCALGRAGIGHAKREGDGMTPAGRHTLDRLWIRADRSGLRASGLPWRLTRASDGWCDDAGSARYNRPVALPFKPSHETMWRADRLYDCVVEIGWNRHPVVRGRGSAIFLHVARPGFAPTEGCVALRRADLLRLLPRLSKRTRIIIRG
jgi:L,D-peptidoglycan transpeptidase YkuD (ErfK/YbiS/YcfS/YnhG family)